MYTLMVIFFILAVIWVGLFFGFIILEFLFDASWDLGDFDKIYMKFGMVILVVMMVAYFFNLGGLLV